MRVHFCAAFYVFLLMRFYELSNAEIAAVYIVIAVVISLEALNSALESTVDLISSNINPLAKKAKDAAAGAVLISAIGAIAVGLAVFGDLDKLKGISKYFFENSVACALLIISFFCWVAFICMPTKNVKLENQKEKDNKHE